METVKVKEVKETKSPKAGKTVYHIELEDGRVATTLSESLAKAAFASRGNEVEAEIAVQEKGNFTNTYLNAIDGVSDRDKPSSNGSRKSAPRGGGRDPKIQATIEKEWAYGQSINLLVGSGEDFNFPLTDDQQKRIDDQAQTLLSKIS